MAGKKQHYVPQFLLRNFALADGAQQVACYRLRERRYLPRVAIRDAAHQNNFYGRASVEDSLAGLEGEASRIIRTAASAYILPRRGSGDQYALMCFVLAQVARTPGAAAETNAFADILAKRLMRDVPELAGHFDKFRIVVDDAPVQTMASATLQTELVRDLAVKVLRNQTEVPFVLGDDPAVLYNQFLEPRKRSGNNVGLAVKGLQVFLPVDPNHALLFFDPAVYKVGGRRLDMHRVDLTGAKDILALNLLQAVNADQALFTDGRVGEHALRSLAGRAAAFRPADKARMVEYLPASGDVARDGTLLRMYRPDVRTRLDLSFVKLTPHAKQYDLRGAVAPRRDPLLCKLHEEFLRRVTGGGGYDVGEFSRFLTDFLNAEERSVRSQARP